MCACTGLFYGDISGELWVRCRKCEQSVHGDCAGEGGEFQCETCCAWSKANCVRFNKIFTSDFIPFNYRQGCTCG
jgi:hypothetical protein